MPTAIKRTGEAQVCRSGIGPCGSGVRWTGEDSPVTPASLQSFFAASASVAGALIGLLFVAISVAHERLTAEDANQAHRVRASAALTSFTNALTVSLFALTRVGIGWPAFVVGVLGLAFVLASLLSLLRARRSQPRALRDALFLVGLVITFGLQLLYGLKVISRANDVSSVDGIAVLVIVCFLIGIARSWELIGGPSIGLGGEIAAIMRTRGDSHDAPTDDGA